MDASGRHVDGAPDYAKRPLHQVLQHLDKIKEHAPKSITSVKRAFNVKPQAYMPPPDNWESWSAVRTRVRGCSFFTPVLQANCTVYSSGGWGEAAGQLSVEQAQMLQKALFHKGVEVSCKNAGMLLLLAVKVGYRDLERSVRDFYGRLAALTEQCAKNRRIQAQRRHDKAVSAAQDKCNSLENKARERCVREIEAAKRKRDEALEAAQAKRRSATRSAERRLKNNKAFLYYSPMNASR